MWIGWKAVSLGLISGGAIAVALYTGMAPSAGPVAASIPVSDTSGATVVYADCVPPAQLEQGECVTHVTVTKTTPASVPVAPVVEYPVSAPAATHRSTPVKSSASTPAASTTPHDDDDDDHEDDHDDDHGADHDEDHGDDEGDD